jgi:hypothetical protein
VVNIEIKKPVGKWENVSGANYGDVEADADTGVPRGASARQHSLFHQAHAG